MKNILTLLLFIPIFSFAQINNKVKVLSQKTGLPLKNVNITVPNIDSIFITDKNGIAEIPVCKGQDSLIFRKFGYHSIVSTINTSTIILDRDTSAFSHNLNLIDLKHKNGFSFILLNIDKEPFWFKQKIGPLRIGNGIELEKGEDYYDIFSYHDIIKTISVQSERCLYGFIGENYANTIIAIYFNPKKNKGKKKKNVPSTMWYNKKQMKLANAIETFAKTELIRAEEGKLRAEAEIIRAKADENNSLANLNYSKIMLEDREVIKVMLEKLK